MIWEIYDLPLDHPMLEELLESMGSGEEVKSYDDEIVNGRWALIILWSGWLEESHRFTSKPLPPRGGG